MKLNRFLALITMGGPTMLCGLVGATKELYCVSEPGYCDGIRVAISIKNYSDSTLGYFYSNLAHDGQDRWYPHDIKAHESTWDWTWIYATTSDHIEFVYNMGTTRCVWFTIVFNYKSGQYPDFKASETLFWTEWDQGQWNPPWTKFIWNKYTGLPHGSCDLVATVHTTITFGNDKDGNLVVDWNGLLLHFNK